MQKALQLIPQQHNQQGVSDWVVTLSWAETAWGGVSREDWCRERCHSKKGRPVVRRCLSSRGMNEPRDCCPWEAWSRQRKGTPIGLQMDEPAVCTHDTQDWGCLHPRNCRILTLGALLNRKAENHTGVRSPIEVRDRCWDWDREASCLSPNPLFPSPEPPRPSQAPSSVSPAFRATVSLQGSE